MAPWRGPSAGGCIALALPLRCHGFRRTGVPQVARMGCHRKETQERVVASVARVRLADSSISVQVLLFGSNDRQYAGPQTVELEPSHTWTVERLPLWERGVVRSEVSFGTGIEVARMWPMAVLHRREYRVAQPWGPLVCSGGGIDGGGALGG